MGEDPGTGRPSVGGTSTSAGTTTSGPEEIQRDIEQTREQLGDTVEALAEKADVKAQAKRKVEETKAAASEKVEQVLGQARQASPDGAAEAASVASQKARENPLPLAAAGAFLAGFLFGRLTKR